MIGEYNKSVILTYIGISISITGMWMAIEGELRIAFLCLILAGICDLFDGVIARKCERSDRAKAFGIQLDSLADVIGFLALPCVIGFSTLGVSGSIGIFYVIAGIIRLAWFNVVTVEEGAKGYFQGLPVTYAALILPVYYLLHLISPQIFVLMGLVPVYLFIGIAFIVNVKIKKPRGLAYGFFALLAIGVGTGILII